MRLDELKAENAKLSALVHMHENTISSREMDLTIRLQDAEAENRRLREAIEKWDAGVVGTHRTCVCDVCERLRKLLQKEVSDEK